MNIVLEGMDAFYSGISNPKELSEHNFCCIPYQLA
jgi:hypothetical protein